MVVVEARVDPRPVAAARLAWLRHELAQWQAVGLVDDATAAAITARYVESRRFSLARLLLGLGGCFVGVGVLWLVAANLESLSPLARVVGTVLLWLALVTSAELLAHRREARGVRSGSALLGVLRLLVAFAYGAVVFQAAQSLQVPAYSSMLLGVWGLGVLFYAYAVSSVPALVVGIVTAVGWYGWTIGERSDGSVAAALAMLVAGTLASAVAVTHQARWLPRFAAPWRETGALLTLIGLFIAALPGAGGASAGGASAGGASAGGASAGGASAGGASAGGASGLPWPDGMWLGLFVVAVAVGAAMVLVGPAGRAGRAEVGAAVAVLVCGLLLLGWAPVESGPDAGGTASFSGAEVLHALVATAVYLGAAAWFAALGVLCDAGRLTGLATAALVLFATVQSFAVFEPILSGAALFLVLGAVFLGSGFLFDRGRRRLAMDVKEVPA